MELNADYWNKRYEEGNTPWDIGRVSPPIQTYIDTLKNKDLRILIPGAGRAYEAVYLHRQGFRHVFVCDWAAEAFSAFRANAPGFPTEQLLASDFFRLEGKFDLVLEQTFFCAIDLERRPDYVRQCHRLLAPGGQMAGLLFASIFAAPGPPFGGSKEAYQRLFSPFFEIVVMHICQNSIPPRQGNELFFHLIAKDL